MKIYTKTGDNGTTSLFSGERVRKNNPRLQVYGTLDELNSTLGLVIARLEKYQDLQSQLWQIQTDLFKISTWVATLPGSENVKKLTPISGDRTIMLEKAMDDIQNSLPELKAFILPGGIVTAATVHIARTVCRRAEREFQSFFQATEYPDYDENMNRISMYLNRLSDYLFCLARYLNFLENYPEKELK
jgi:cob(I)alamin adenosyltransferase